MRGLERKSTRTDMVSDADRDAETVIEQILLSERPEDGLLAEEGAARESGNGRRWVVDPLDGTTNYLYGLAGWAVSIALEIDGDGAVGVVHAPATGETFTAIRGSGALLDGERVECSGRETLETSLISTGFAYEAGRRAEQAAVVGALLPRVRDIRRLGAASLDLCAVACGRVDGYYERGLEPWDWAAGSLIATEAGAVIEPLAGEVPGLLAATPAIAAGLRELVG